MARRNIGVAIAVPQPFGKDLQSWRRRLGDPAAMRIPPHVTLLPPTAVPSERLPVVEEHLRRIAVEEAPFTITLRGTGTFRPVSPVTFVQLAEGISRCERLEARVRSGPLFRQTKFNYHPHVTLAHDVDADALERGFVELKDYEATFDVRGFTLFEEGTDKVWRPQRDFPFGQQAGSPGE
ncbi:MAG TPA: 2'-5' RNA ligase family protein [Frankiaceae bacterium]|nr:2'-5' RNA ligase family protein [Frankiaceae bacterium]